MQEMRAVRMIDIARPPFPLIRRLTGAPGWLGLYIAIGGDCNEIVWLCHRKMIMSYLRKVEMSY